MRFLPPLIAAAGLALAGAATACAGLLDMGALILPYSPHIWTTEQVGPNHWRATPRDAQEGAPIEATIVDTPCTELAMAAELETERNPDDVRTGTRSNRHGMTIVWASSWTGCRNLTASPIAACVREGDKTYLFRTIPMGCRLARYGEAAPFTLVEGLQRRD